MNTKEKIMESAIEIISLKGFNASTTKEIAENSGYSEAMLFRHFRTKKTLLNEILKKFISNIEKNLEIANIINIIDENIENSFEEILDMIITDRLRLVERNFSMIKIIFSELRYHDEIKAVFRDKVIGPVNAEFKKLVDYQRKKGVIDETDADTLIKAFYSGMFFPVLQRVVTDTEFNRGQVENEIMKIKKVILYGVLKKEEQR